MLCDIAIIVFHGAHKPVVHAASHVVHEKKITWFSMCVYAHGVLPIVMVLCLADLWAA